ncbi:hypothetical protein GGI05_005648 [Coemansia sp. RSA 2603]|nr:hypothetical protein GGI05_005648 [Coemansia sp. RSA 2603]
MPVLNMTSTDLRCRSDALTNPSIPSFSVKANDVITLWWEQDSMSPITGTFDPPMGPCTTYLARYASHGNGPQWFNIYKNGYVNGRWCSQTINDLNNGGLNVRIPSGILYGTYLLRAEIIDLTNANMTNNEDYTQGAAFFANCIKIEIDSDGSEVPAGSYIPGIYTPEDPSLLGDFSGDQSDYVVPGPAEYKFQSLESTGLNDTVSSDIEDANNNQIGMSVDDSSTLIATSTNTSGSTSASTRASTSVSASTSTSINISISTSVSSMSMATALPIANELVNLN